MLILSSITDDFARIANVESDGEAEQMIEDCVIRAGVEIKQRAREARKTEKSYRQSNKIHEAKREKEAKGNRERIAKSIAEGRERNKALKTYEDHYPEPRRHWPG